MEISSLRQETKDALANQRRELTAAIGTQKQETSAAMATQKRETSAAMANQRRELTAAMATQKQEIGHRIDRLEDRVDENHREVRAALAELKVLVSVLSVKLDERSHPRRLESAELSSAGADVAAAAVRETPDPYPTERAADRSGEGAGEQPPAPSRRG